MIEPQNIRARFHKELRLILSCVPIDPLHTTSHSQKAPPLRPKGGSSLDDSCSLCVKMCVGPHRTCSISRCARGLSVLLTKV